MEDGVDTDEQAVSEYPSWRIRSGLGTDHGAYAVFGGATGDRISRDGLSERSGR